MSNTQVAAPPTPQPTLPCPLPAAAADEPEALGAYRASPGDARAFLKLRRTLREQERWRDLAVLLSLHAAHMEPGPKAAELAAQAYELFLERAKDRKEAAHALARAVMLAPERARNLERLRKLYAQLGWHEPLADLLRWQIGGAASDPARAAALHMELAELLETHLADLLQAVEHYRQALALDPSLSQASEHLIQIFLRAGAWSAAVEAIEHELAHLDPAQAPERVAQLHRRVAWIQSLHQDNVAGAARHLQAALKARPDDLDALRAFGDLYLESGKATEEGLAKAADIFFKAAQIARRASDHDQALQLLRRALELRPDHVDASAALEQTLIDAQDWTGLDELYAQWLEYVSGVDAVPYLLRRAELLEEQLDRVEDARRLYEEASRYQGPEAESWQALARIYEATGDVHALASLLESRAERMAEQVTTDQLLRIAELYRDQLGNEEQAAVFYYKVLEREPFSDVAFEGYKEHWRRKHAWAHLRDLILYQIDQAAAVQGPGSPLDRPEFAEEYVELAEICERRLGDIDGALDAWGRMAAAYPHDDRPQRQIARIEKRARMWDNMVRVQEAELARTSDPRRRLDVLRRLTQVYRDRTADPTRAIELYHEILEIQPDDIQSTRALTALYDRAGDHERVVELLREQYERSRSNTERVSLLRRMAELWHNELDRPDDALWACEQVLTHVPAEREALHRMQRILEERGDHEGLLAALDRELQVSSSTEDKARLLRRMAQIAERDLSDMGRAAELWDRLHQLDPHDLQVVDRLAHVYESTERHEELGTLLTQAAASARTPKVRQLDYLLRLGHLALGPLADPEAARDAFERALRLRPDHEGALRALSEIYRDEKDWRPRVRVLGALQQRAASPEEEFHLAWERMEILADHLDDPTAAARVLEDLDEALHIAHPQLREVLLDLYDRAGQHHSAVEIAELSLLSTQDPSERAELYRTISDIWLRHLGNPRAALSAYGRYVQEFPDDADGLWTLSNLQRDVGQHASALATAQRRLALLADPTAQITTLEYMAELAETGLDDPTQAMSFIRRAIDLEPESAPLRERARKLAERKGIWPAYLGIVDALIGHGEGEGAWDDVERLCLEASEIAEAHLEDPVLAFTWARRAYFRALDHGPDPKEADARMEALAKTHGLWEDLLAAIEQECAREAPEGTVLAEPAAHNPRLLRAADVALDHLRDPNRALGYLEQALARAPDDAELHDRLVRTARAHRAFDTLLAVYRADLDRAETNLGRLDAYRNLAQVEERDRKDPAAAMEWLRRGWLDLRPRDESLAADIEEEIFALSKRRSMHAPLAAHLMTRAEVAFEAGDDTAGLDDLAEAAQIYADRMGDPLAAIRALTQGLPHDPDGAATLDRARPLATRLDRKAPAQGTLALLAIHGRVVSLSAETADKVRHLEARARLREDKLSDPRGAMAEWLRVLVIDPAHDRARAEVRRLADAHDLWAEYLLLPGFELQRAEDDTARAQTFEEIAEVFEGHLDRLEYALRARICGWRLHPELPPRVGDLPPEHATLWRLAEAVGPYTKPPVPRDRLLEPHIELPEHADAARWNEAGLPADVALRAPGEALAVSPATAAPAGQVEEIEELEDIEEVEDIEEIEELEEVEEIEELEEVEDIEEIEEIEELEDTGPVRDAGGTDVVELPSADLETAVGSAPKPAPPPPARPLHLDVPPVPSLRGPLLPPRPEVTRAWEELAAAYQQAPAPSKPERAAMELALARMWEEGAHDLPQAFAAFERALSLVPEEPEALAALEDLARRNDQIDRWLATLDHLLADAALPEHVIAQNLRIAAICEETEDWPGAEQRYRAVLAVLPRHEQALEKLSAIYQREERWADFVEVYTELLHAQAPELDEDERVARTRHIARILERELDRTTDAIEVLERLLRELPDRSELHEDLTEILLAHQQWNKAIDALRTAAEAAGDDETRRTFLERIARVYQENLQILERAAEAWSAVLEIAPDDPGALSALQDLYLQLGRHDDLLPLLDRRLEPGAALEPGARTHLLVAKARALHEGLGDTEAALEILEGLHAESPGDDEVTLGLARLYAAVGRSEDRLNLLHQHMAALPAEAHGRRAALARELARDLLDDGRAAAAMEVLDEALAALPQEQEAAAREDLLRLQLDTARTLGDEARLAQALEAVGGSDELLQAADLYRSHLDDEARAVRLYSRVLAEAKSDPQDTRGARLAAAALEGLVRMRVDGGDREGAMDFMDRQLEDTPEGPLQAHLLAEVGRIIYRVTADVEAARTRLESALAKDAEHVPALLGLGEVLLDSGDAQAAEPHVEAALEQVSMSDDRTLLVPALLLMARVLEDTGRVGDAYRRLTAALRHDPDDMDIRRAIVHNRERAERWRDVRAAGEQLVKHLEARPPLEGRHATLAAQIFLAAADAVAHLGRPDDAPAWVERAVAVAPRDPIALARSVTHLSELGDLGGAAGRARELALASEDPAARALAFIDAGLLAHGAAELGEGGDLEDSARRAVDALSTGLALASELAEAHPNAAPIVDAERLVRALDACAGPRPDLAVAAVDLIRRDHDADPELRLSALLEGAVLARHLEDERGPARAEAFARAALEIDPRNADAVLALADALAQLGRTDEIDPLVDEFLERAGAPDADAARAQAALLVRVSLLHDAADPARAAAALERAAELSPEVLTADARARLAELYQQTDAPSERVLDNHRALLALDPTHVPSLAAVAAHAAESGELERAYILYDTITLLAPGHEQARAFLDTHSPQGDPTGPLDVDALLPPPEPDAGVAAALATLWEGGTSVLGDHLPQLEIGEAARVSPVGDGPLSRAWGETLKRLDTRKVALLRASELDLDPLWPDDAMIRVVCQHPPLLIASRRAVECDDLSCLRFALGRAAFLTRPETVLALGLAHDGFMRVLSALLLAFHPRHAGRKRTDPDEGLRKLGQELARKTAIRVSRQISGAFKDHADEPFASDAWRAHMARRANRVGLALGGDLRGALRALAPDGDPHELLRGGTDDPEILDLLRFATSPEFAAMRRELGWTVPGPGGSPRGDEDVAEDGGAPPAGGDDVEPSGGQTESESTEDDA